MARVLDEYGLNIKQRRFVELFLVTGNATQAWIDAGYSRSSASANASKALRTNEQVKAALSALKPEPVRISEELTPEYVLNGLKREAEEGETSAARTAALRELGRALGLFVDRTQTVNVSLGDELDELERRVSEKMTIVGNQ